VVGAAGATGTTPAAGTVAVAVLVDAQLSVPAPFTVPLPLDNRVAQQDGVLLKICTPYMEEPKLL